MTDRILCRLSALFPALLPLVRLSPLLPVVIFPLLPLSLPPSSILLDRVSTYPLFSANEKKERERKKIKTRVWYRLCVNRAISPVQRIGEKGLARELNDIVS